VSNENDDSIDGPAQTSGDNYAALTDTVRELVKVMRDGGIGKLDVRRGDLRISLETLPAAITVTAAPVPGGMPIVPIDPAPAPEDDASSHVIASPMIGTYYAAPAPDEPPFLQIGELVAVGQTVAIIEAMKIMNEIVSERAGRVEEIYVTNGEAVEYGHPLLRLRLHQHVPE
jgi:acetyl-CoA carboxylase biotin carboxyl carrier protein